MWDRLKLFLNPFDRRYEELLNKQWHLIVLRDFSAGLIVAMMAIPLAMGFAMASGLKPEQGIVGGAVAGLVGALFGGSKYQVYGPTAAFIPVFAGVMATFVPIYGFDQAHGLLVTAAIVSGIILIVMGVTGMGKLANFVPHSIVVGFTIGIAVTIALSQVTEVLGLPELKNAKFLAKVEHIGNHVGQFKSAAMLLALVTFLCTHVLLKISKYLPAPLIAIGIGILLSGAMVGGQENLIRHRYGEIPTDFFLITPPAMPEWNWQVMQFLGYLVAAIVFVSGVESLLCSRMADRLADNRGTPFNPNKEFWGQGLVQILVPLLNGFPHTGALARTATNIKVGAVTPLAGVFKCFLKLALAFYLASYLELVPMACIGGILVWVAFNMVKPAEVKQVFAHNWFHVALMIYTAVAVIVTDFLTGVLTSTVLYAALFKFLDKPAAAAEHEGQSTHGTAGSSAKGAKTAENGQAAGTGEATASKQHE
jgi:MFS superfamily sulfate permease-like transporter